MPLTPNTLRRIDNFTTLTQGQQEPGLFNYLSNDTLVTIAGAGYFNSLADRLPVGSVIIVAAGIGGTPAGEHYIVSGNTGTAVTLTAFS
jgi:hypothetical protein